MRAFSSLCFPLALPVTLLLAACNEPGRIDLRLRAPDGLDLGTVDALEVALLSEPDGARIAEGQTTGGRLEDLDTISSRADVDADRPYVFEVRGEAAACESGRLVGRSLPFEIESNESTETVTMYVACTDSFARTEGTMQSERSFFAAVWDPASSGAILIGGASRALFRPPDAVPELTPLGSVESYDIVSGEFSREEDLTGARAAPAAEVLDSGQIVVLGGIGPAVVEGVPFDPLDTVEVLEGGARRGLVNLAYKWVETSSLLLRDGTIAIVGAAVYGEDWDWSPRQAEVYDAVRSLNVASLPPMYETSGRWGATVVALRGRDRAVMVGGAVMTGDVVVESSPPPALFDGSAKCDAVDPPCLGLVTGDGDPDGFGPGPEWKSATGAWASCPTGGGTAFFVGGEIGDPPEQVADVFCFHDDPAGDPGPLRRIGALKHARSSAGAILVRGSRILVVGGSSGAEGFIDIAEVFPVETCTCDQEIDPADIEEVAIDLDGSMLARPAMLTLGDGTVLVGGAVTVEAADELTATSAAWIFQPDL